MRKASIILFIFLSFFPIYKINAQETSNAGFVSSNNIWYSKDPFEDGDIIEIYTSVFNPDEKQLSGTVVFFDNDLLLGTKDFVIPPNGVQGIHISWKVNAGDHLIFGRIEKAKFLIANNKYEDVFLAENQTAKSSRNVLKKIIPNTTVTTNIVGNNNNPSSDTFSKTSTANPNLIQNIENTVVEKTPPIISQPVISTSNFIENFRKNYGVSLEKKKKNMTDEIKKIDETKTSNTSNSKEKDDTKIIKPFKYIELFFSTLFSFIFNNKVPFYGISISSIFFLLRFVWLKIF